MNTRVSFESSTHFVLLNALRAAQRFAAQIFVIFALASCAQTHSSSKLRLGYLLNMTHAVPIVGIESAKFTNIDSQYFVSGGYLLNGLITKNIDIAYLGPGPYLNALNKGVDLKLLAVSSIGANSFIVSEDFEPGEAYIVEKMAIPQLGNTQDLLAKIFVNKFSKHKNRVASMPPSMKNLASIQGIEFAEDLEFIPVNPAELETAFYTGAVDSALVPEPWGTILEKKGLVNLSSMLETGPVSLVDELEGVIDAKFRDELKALNDFPAALLVVDQEYYDSHKAEVEKFLEEQNNVLDLIAEDKEASIAIIRKHLEKTTKKKFDMDFLIGSFNRVKFEDKLDNTKLDDLLEASVNAKYLRTGG